MTLLQAQTKAPKTKYRPPTQRRYQGRSIGETIASSSSAQRFYGESKSHTVFSYSFDSNSFPLRFQPICLEYAFASADPNRIAHGHQQHVVQSLLFGQICGVYDFSSGRQLRPKSLHNERIDACRLLHNYRRLSNLRAWIAVQGPHFMHGWALFDRSQ